MSYMDPEQAAQVLEQLGKAGLLPRHPALFAQHPLGKGGLVRHDQVILPKGGKGVNALDQRVFFRNLRKAAGAPHHKAHVRPFRFCQALLDGLK